MYMSTTTICEPSRIVAVAGQVAYVGPAISFSLFMDVVEKHLLKTDAVRVELEAQW